MLRNYRTKSVKMDSFTTVILLGLLALGHATPLTTVTQIPRTDDEVLREALTDGFLVDQHFLTSMTTQSPNRETTPQMTTTSQESTTTQQLATTQKSEPTVTEESVSVEDEESTKVEVSATADNGTVAEETAPGEDGEEGSTMGEDDQDSIFGRVIRHSDTASTVQPMETSTVTTSPEGDKEAERTTMTDLLDSMSEEGSGEEHTKSTTTETTTMKVTHTSDVNFKMFTDSEGSGSTEEPLTTTDITTTIGMVIAKGRGFIQDSDRDSEVELSTKTQVKAEPQSVTEKKGHHVTPDWVIIVGFLVGIAALVLLCVAIATRDKWNGPNQFNRTIAELPLTNEQKAVEMETFLHNEQPKENGKAEEYTVIPLDELPDNYSS